MSHRPLVPILMLSVPLIAAKPAPAPAVRAPQPQLATPVTPAIDLSKPLLERFKLGEHVAVHYADAMLELTREGLHASVRATCAPTWNDAFADTRRTRPCTVDEMRGALRLNLGGRYARKDVHLDATPTTAGSGVFSAELSLEQLAKSLGITNQALGDVSIIAEWVVSPVLDNRSTLLKSYSDLADGRGRLIGRNKEDGMLLPSFEFMTPLKADVAPPFAAVMFDPDAASNPTLAWLDSATGPVEVTGIDRVDGGYVASLSVRGKLEIPMTELAMVCSERTLLQAKPNPYWPRMWQHLAPKQWMEWLVVSGSGDGLRYVADGWGGVINDKIYSGQDGETSAALVDMLTPFDPLRARVARAGAYHAAVSAYAENQPAPLCSGNWMNSTVKDWTRRSLERWGSDGQAPVVPTPLIANVPAKSARDLKAIKEWCATRSVPAFDPSGRSPWVAVGAAVWPYDTERMDARGEWPKSVAPPDRGFTPAFCDGLRRAVTAGEDFGAWGPWVESEALPLCAVAEPLWPRFLSDAVDAAMTIQGWKHAPAVECRVPVGVAPVSVQIPPDLPAGTKSVPAYLFTPELPPGWVPTYDPSIVASKDSRLDFGVVFSEDQVAEVYQ